MITWTETRVKIELKGKKKARAPARQKKYHTKVTPPSSPLTPAATHAHVPCPPPTPLKVNALTATNQWRKLCIYS